MQHSSFNFFPPHTPLYVGFLFPQYFRARGNSCGYCHSYGEAGSNHTVEEEGDVRVSWNRRLSYDIRARGFIFNSFISCRQVTMAARCNLLCWGLPPRALVLFISRCVTFASFFSFRTSYLLRLQFRFTSLLNKLLLPSVHPGSRTEVGIYFFFPSRSL